VEGEEIEMEGAFLLGDDLVKFCGVGKIDVSLAQADGDVVGQNRGAPLGENGELKPVAVQMPPGG
jgi:hypothetical protein